MRTLSPLLRFVDPATAAIVGSVLSAGASVAGIPWQQNLQKELMHENESINIAQWNRENEYNSPKNQMKRLKAAGLNPDLAITGNVPNTAGSAQPTAGTPQGPGAANAVSQAVHNGLAAATLDSQIDVNESTAKKQNAEAEKVGTETDFNVASFQLRLNNLFQQYLFSKAQTAEARSNVELISMKTLEVQKNIDNFNELFRLYDAQRENLKADTRLKGFQSGLAHVDLLRRNDFISSEIGKMESEIGLNKALADRYRIETSFLFATFANRKTIIHNEAFFNRPQDKYYESLYRYQKAYINYLPYQMAEIMFNAEKYFKRDKDGNVLYNDDGSPQLDEGYMLWQKGVSYVNDVTTQLENLSNSVKNIAISYGMFRGGGIPISGNFKEPKGGFDQSYNDYLYMRYTEAPPFSYEQAAARQAWKNYRSKHGL